MIIYTVYTALMGFLYQRKQFMPGRNKHVLKGHYYREHRKKIYHKEHKEHKEIIPIDGKSEVYFLTGLTG